MQVSQTLVCNWPDKKKKVFISVWNQIFIFREKLKKKNKVNQTDTGHLSLPMMNDYLATVSIDALTNPIDRRWLAVVLLFDGPPYRPVDADDLLSIRELTVTYLFVVFASIFWHIATILNKENTTEALMEDYRA